MRISDAAEKLNKLSKGYAIGDLQTLREKLRGRPSRTYKIFTSTTVFDDYAFHDGGRHELQFNIGMENRNNESVFRHGVAFSLEPSRAHTDVSELFPKLDRFNYYIRTSADEFPGFKMWYWSGNRRSMDHYPRPFEPDEAKLRNFLFFGKWTPVRNIDFDDILRDFDLLLPLYAFVEKGDYVAPSDRVAQFSPGCSTKKSKTTTTYTERQLDVALRHNELQLALYDCLCKEFGSDNVATEHWLDVGGRVDAAVRDKAGMIFYEIKVVPSARGAFREGIGQLLEYAYWPNSSRAHELVIVGEAPVLPDAIEYLKFLRKNLGLRLFYRQLDMSTRRLKPPQ